MSDNGFLRNDKLKSVLSRIKSRVGSDIASAISESTSSLSSVITSGDLSSLNEAKGYADGLKAIIDSNITNGDSSTLSSAKSYTDGKISSVNSAINDLIESIPGQINLALETYENSIDYADATDLSNHTSNTSNPHSVTYTQTGAAAASHTHVEADITDLGSYANSSHTHTESDITDLGNYATASHSHNLSDINSITASSTEINYLSGATGNIQQQLNSLVTSGSTLTLADLGGASSTDLSNHTGNTNNPHSVTYSQVGAAPTSHTHTESDITDLGSYANSIHTHTESDITDLGNYASSSHTHMVSDITDVSSLASASHTHVEADIIDLGNYASSNHTHTLSNITDVIASNTEVNYLVNSTRNIQTQINDARMYGFFPAWEYQHEYNIEDCIKIPCCKITQYLECIVGGVSGSCPEYPTGQTEIYYTVEDGEVVRHERSIDYKLDEFIAVVNGQCIVDGTCVWLVQDIRDARVIGSITPLLWRPMYVYDAFDNYGIGIYNTVRLYDGRSSKQSDMSKADNLKFIRLLKRIMGSAIFTLNMSRIFKLNSNSAINSSSSTELSHMGGALIILDWCFRPFDYLSSSHYNDIDSRASKYIENMLSYYNSEFSVNLTKTQIVNDAIAKKTKIYNNQITNDYLYFESNGIGKYAIMQSGNYGIFKDAGLPNITGSISSIRGYQGSSVSNSSNSSALYWSSIQTSTSNYASQQQSITSGNKAGVNVQFNASRSNSIYGNSTTVQPNTLQVYYYMKY